MIISFKYNRTTGFYVYTMFQNKDFINNGINALLKVERVNP